MLPTLFEASRKGTPLIIDHPAAGVRPVGGVWPHPRGIVFADVAWNSPENDTGHTFHVIEGKFDPGLWKCGTADFFVIEPDDPLFEDEFEEVLVWRTWEAEEKITPAASYDRGAEVIAEFFSD